MFRPVCSPAFRQTASFLMRGQPKSAHSIRSFSSNSFLFGRQSAGLWNSLRTGFVKRPFSSNVGVTGTSRIVTQSFVGFFAGTKLHGLELVNTDQIQLPKTELVASFQEEKSRNSVVVQETAVVLTRLASRLNRFCAFCIDAVIVALLSAIPYIGGAFCLLNLVRDCMTDVGSFGKKALGLRVVDKKTGEIATSQKRLVRNASEGILTMVTLGIFGFVDFFYFLWSNDRIVDRFLELEIRKEFKPTEGTLEMEEVKEGSESV